MFILASSSSHADIGVPFLGPDKNRNTVTQSRSSACAHCFAAIFTPMTTTSRRDREALSEVQTREECRSSQPVEAKGSPHG